MRYFVSTGFTMFSLNKFRFSVCFYNRKPLIFSFQLWVGVLCFDILVVDLKWKFCPNFEILVFFLNFFRFGCLIFETSKFVSLRFYYLFLSFQFGNKNSATDLCFFFWIWKKTSIKMYGSITYKIGKTGKWTTLGSLRSSLRGMKSYYLSDWLRQGSILRTFLGFIMNFLI